MSASATTTNCYYWFLKTYVYHKTLRITVTINMASTFLISTLSAYIDTAEKHYMRTSPFTWGRVSQGKQYSATCCLSWSLTFWFVYLFLKWSLLLWTHSEKQPFFMACSLDLGHYFKFLSLRFCFKQLLSYIFTTLSTSPAGNLISLCSKIGVSCMQPTDC